MRILKKYWWAKVLLGLLLVAVVFGSLCIVDGRITIIKWFYHPDKVDNPDAIEVDFVELEAFLRSYAFPNFEPTWRCEEFALAFHDAAEAKGIKTAFVLVKEKGGFWDFHAFNAVQIKGGEIIYLDTSIGIFVYNEQDAALTDTTPEKWAVAQEIDGVYVVKGEMNNPRTGRVHFRESELGEEENFYIIW